MAHVTAYVFDLLPEDCRLRHWHQQVRKRVVEFVVQLEYWSGERWEPIVRYDTAHGFAHRDLYRPGRALEKTPLGLADLNEALTIAEQDLKANWRLYRDRYVKERARDD
jgi:hypothetical protein